MATTFPDRLSGLINKLEANEPVTRQDLHRLAALQSLDVVKIGQDFVREVIEMNDEAIKFIEAME